MRYPFTPALFQSIFLRRLVVVVVFFGSLIFLLWFLPWAVNPVKPSREKIEADRRWVDTSPYWLDRQACRWLSLCGLAHVREDPAEGRSRVDRGSDGDGAGGREGSWLSAGWEEREELRRRTGGVGGSDKRSGNRTLREIPQYVLDHAPLVHLYSGEYFWPSDIEDHLLHMEAKSARGKKIKTTTPPKLNNLSELDSRGREVFLTSQVDVEERPDWLHSKGNIPVPFADESYEDHEDGWSSENGQDEISLRPAESTTWFDIDAAHPTNRISDPRQKPAGGQPTNHGLVSTTSTSQRPRAFHPDYRRQRRNTIIHDKKGSTAGYSSAPATLILVDKGSGIVDAFWFFFYAYNFGQTVLGVRYGNHVGDWEHTMIRFESGVPRAVYFSEHEGGQAYVWSAVEKYLVRTNNSSTQGERYDSGSGTAKSTVRPVIYSAVGSHAMYATSGDHPYVLPFKMLRDVTDKGPLWDPAKNVKSYWYDYTTPPSSSSSPSLEDDENEISDRGLLPTSANPNAPTSWFHYMGRWGDNYYTLANERQYRLFGQYHYVAGPQGPKAKNLGRSKVCQSEERCRMIYSLDEGRRKGWH